MEEEIKITIKERDPAVVTLQADYDSGDRTTLHIPAEIYDTIIKEGNRRRHKTSFGNGRSKYTDDKSFSDSKKYAMPSKLMKEITKL